MRCFSDKLDPDLEEYLLANGLKGQDILDLGACSCSRERPGDDLRSR
jgi:hypothetical protein